MKALAELPSLDALRAKLLGMLNTPATRIAGVLQAPAGQLARVFAAYADANKSERGLTRFAKLVAERKAARCGLAVKPIKAYLHERHLQWLI